MLAAGIRTSVKDPMMYEVTDDSQRGGGKLLPLLALGALLAGSWRCVAQTHQRRYGSRSKPLPERLQTWEGEGGRPEPAEADSDAECAPSAGGPR